MLANLITAARVGLVFIGIALLYTRTVWGGLAAFAAVLIAIIMDWLDGYLARRTHTDTPMGAVLDILGDRIIENSLWIVFAHLGLIPVWVPIVVVVRGFVTDGFRSVALTKGQTPFGEKTMIRSRLGRLIVTSRTSRALYAGAKIVAFCYLILYFTLLQGRPPTLDDSYSDTIITFPNGLSMQAVGLAIVYFTVALCLIRAIPVVQDGIAVLKQANTEPH